MSHVTDIILIDSGLNYSKYFKEIERWLEEHHHWCSLRQLNEKAGGNKVMQCDVFMGAFNHMDIEAFIEYFNSVEWNDREGIQLLIKDEHDDEFTMWGFKGNKLASK